MEHIPYMVFAMIPAFASGLVIGGYIARRCYIADRWRRTRNRIPAKEIVAAMKENAKRKEGAE